VPQRTGIFVGGTLVAETGSWSMTTVARGYIGECCGCLTSYPLHLFLLADRGVPAGQGPILEVIDGMQRLNAIFSHIEHVVGWNEPIRHSLN
jgi:hypothetical protein